MCLNKYTVQGWKIKSGSSPIAHSQPKFTSPEVGGLVAMNICHTDHHSVIEPNWKTEFINTPGVCRPQKISSHIWWPFAFFQNILLYFFHDTFLDYNYCSPFPFVHIISRLFMGRNHHPKIFVLQHSTGQRTNVEIGLQSQDFQCFKYWTLRQKMNQQSITLVLLFVMFIFTKMLWERSWRLESTGVVRLICLKWNIRIKVLQRKQYLHIVKVALKITQLLSFSESRV